MEFAVRIWKWSFSFLIFRRILLGNIERRLGEKKLKIKHGVTILKRILTESAY